MKKTKVKKQKTLKKQGCSILSLVTLNSLPTSSSVLDFPSSNPNLNFNTFASLGVNAVSYTHLDVYKRQE